MAAIEEIVRTTDKSILVCAQSNSACDDITLRLLQILQRGELFRIYAKTIQKDAVNKKIAQISNLKNGKIEIPSLKYLYKFRVIVCTLCTAAIFSRGRIDPNFDSSHFSYVFIDEAACIQSTTTFIPIAGVCSERRKINCKIILSGDPKQLAPVVMSQAAKELGFQRSFMEFLFDQNCYRPSPITKDFNPKYIVQLKKNYRSHPKILQIANEMFYENRLQAAASAGFYNFFIFYHV